MDGATSDVTASEEVEVKHVEWEAYQEVWGQMCGRGSVFKKALADREALKQQLETRLEVNKKILPSKLGYHHRVVRFVSIACCSRVGQ